MIQEIAILSTAGKPIYYYGKRSESEVATLCMVIVGCVAHTERDNSDNQLQHVKSTDATTISFLHKRPLILLAITSSRISQSVRKLLQLLHDQIVSTLTRSRICTVFEQAGAGFDLRNLLSGTESMTSCLVESVTRQHPALITSSVQVSAFDQQKAAQSAIKSAFEQALAKSENMIFAMLYSRQGKLLAIAQRKNGYTLHERDALILSNMVSRSGFEPGENWVPICLPNSIDPDLFAQLYMRKDIAGDDCCLVLISNFHKEEEFHIVAAVAAELEKKWRNIGQVRTSDTLADNKKYLFSDTSSSLFSAVIITQKHDNSNFLPQCVHFNYTFDEHFAVAYAELYELANEQQLDFLLHTSGNVTGCYWLRDGLEFMALFDSLVEHSEVVDCMQTLCNRLQSAHGQYFIHVTTF